MTNSTNLDADLDAMTQEELLRAARGMRQAIREHRAATGHHLCWYTPELWDHLPEAASAEPQVPPRGEFLQKCAEYRDSLRDASGGPAIRHGK